jgi:hypothetical protein
MPAVTRHADNEDRWKPVNTSGKEGGTEELEAPCVGVAGEGQRAQPN